ncbi:Demethylmenaquinone methyltransferase [Delftia tsuruhatensis]|uniref:class I SAM-dependent methyltransferase n=1 Tax=Delftia tsuruhatensis TaxID=180282 RepID=UPI001E781E26|nr:class I SAM-dependent methyltransferase [Delftia tsuruhatensis]CAB5719152.1 Demethylmenaquinone methyltransferase [Delftia tsuruhatensis]CAC9687761.1 Demethylmenaquinone methyltransferase [Delftia tsuruhatensis]
MTIVLALIALLAVASLAWRLSSRRHALPCPSWLRWMVELDNPFAVSNKAAFIVAQLQIHPGMKVLDAGCGPGRVTLPLARAVGDTGQVLAVDLQPAMLEQVVAKAKAQGLENVRTLAAALGQGQLPAGQYDRAVMAAVLGEIPDRAAALADLFQSLRPGGLLAVAELVFDPHFQRRSTVERLAHDAGFAPHSFHGHAAAYLLVLQRPPTP